MDELAALLQEQDGLLTRVQALGAGATATWIARALRRGEWVAVHPGVYAEHAGSRPLASFRPHVWNMERFLDRVDAEYGGVHGLAMSIGVDEETVARLSRRLLDV